MSRKMPAQFDPKQYAEFLARIVRDCLLTGAKQGRNQSLETRAMPDGTIQLIITSGPERKPAAE